MFCWMHLFAYGYSLFLPPDTRGLSTVWSISQLPKHRIFTLKVSLLIAHNIYSNFYTKLEPGRLILNLTMLLHKLISYSSCHHRSLKQRFVFLRRGKNKLDWNFWPSWKIAICIVGMPKSYLPTPLHMLRSSNNAAQTLQSLISRTSFGI